MQNLRRTEIFGAIENSVDLSDIDRLIAQAEARLRGLESEKREIRVPACVPERMD